MAIRLYHLAHELSLRGPDLLAKLEEGGLKVASLMTVLDDEKAAQARRVATGEEKVVAARRWCRALRREVSECEARLGQLGTWLDGDLPKALAALDSMSDALARYLEVAPMATPNARPSADAPRGTTEELDHAARGEPGDSPRPRLRLLHLQP